METKNPCMLIREANKNDCSLLAELIRDSFITVANRFDLNKVNCPTHPSNCTTDWIEKDFTKGRKYYILESSGTPVGCVGLEKANVDLCYLERLAVLPHHRNKGFGKALVDTVMYEAQALNVKRVSIGIIADDVELKEWYQKMGFIEEETKKFYHLPFMVTFMSYDF